MCSNVDDFNYRNLFWTAEFLHKAIYIIHIEKHYIYTELIVKYNIGLKTHLQRSISEPICYGD